MAKGLPISYILFLLLALISVEHMVLKVDANTCYTTLGACPDEEACRKACKQRLHGQGYCEYDAKPNLPRVCTCQYNCS
ncbi:hypothetical protein AQUCO_00800225v1 [Aquilegia coerulea]|uniref:Knottin scorpion toxin-like domain-containing protein n=1 Tax=Aquilegia coerulea TaxID=218851 RepID=A0A2G5EHX3_AQUCA|nr:hypothetical protein AQUCO_00800225v1 [Aquilegia coerulea]